MRIRLIEEFMKLRGYDIPKARQELKVIQELKNVELETWNLEQRWNIAKFHHQNNQFYQNIIGPSFPNEWDQLPIMEKTDFQNRVPAIRDALLVLLSSKESQLLRTVNGKRRIREEIMTRVNGVMSKGKISNVFFTDFIIQ